MKPSDAVTESELRQARAESYAAMADAVAAKLPAQERSRIETERTSPSFRSRQGLHRQFLARREDFPGLAAVDADDHVRFACLLAASEVALAIGSLLCRCGRPAEVCITGRSLSYVCKGDTKSVPGTYFEARIVTYALVSREVANALWNAVLAALADGTLIFDGLRSRNDPDGTLRVRFE